MRWNKKKRSPKKEVRGTDFEKEKSEKKKWNEKRSPDGLSLPNQNIIIINIIC